LEKQEEVRQLQQHFDSKVEYLRKERKVVVARLTEKKYVRKGSAKDVR